MAIKYQIALTAEEQINLTEYLKNPSVARHKREHARILLSLDENGPALTEKEVAQVCVVSLKTVERTRKRCVEEGLQIAVDSKFNGIARPRKLHGLGQAQLTTIACSEAPKGAAKWTLNLLAERMVELNYVDSISPATIGRELKKNELKPWNNEEWCIPPKENADFVCAMEDVLDIYQQPEDPKRPLVCLDESSKQQVQETRHPLTMKPGSCEKFDTEYMRNGVSHLFMVFSPLEGRRRVEVTDNHNAVTWAHQIKKLVDEDYPEADKIVLVMDNLNTHTCASLYKAFSPEEARRLSEKLEIHYTPKHGSWLNMAEIEFSVLSRQCLSRRIPDQKTLIQEVDAWKNGRNSLEASVNWRFTTKDARIKLKKLYPTIN